MGKHRHKKSFYDVDEDQFESPRKSHRRHRREHSNGKHHERKQRVPSISSLPNSKLDEDDMALLSPPVKRKRSASNTSQSPSKILSQFIEDPEFLANAGPKAIEFVETARQLLAKPNLDATTQQIICAMAQAAVNVGKKLSSVGSTPTDQCVDEISIANSTAYSSSTLLSPTLSTASSSSSSTTPHHHHQQQQQQCHSILSRADNRTSNEPESDEDILIKQMIERAMKLTQQGDTRHAQHLLGIIHEKLSNKRKRAAVAAELANSNEQERTKISSSDDFYSLPSAFNEDSQNSNHKISSSESEQSNDYQSMTSFSYPPPPPLPPPPPPPPLPDADATISPTISVSCIEQVQELLSNPSEVQDILKKLFGANETARVSPPEEYQMQSHLASSPSFPPSIYSSTAAAMRIPPSSLISPLGVPIAEPQPYNSSLAFIQGNRRNLPPLQTPDRCFSSSNNKTSKPPPSRSFSSSSSNTGTMSSSANPPLSAPPLMKVNPTFSYASTAPPIAENMPSRWTPNNEQQRTFHPFWCATCALGFPHQVAYQDHLRSHISCNVNGCFYAASESVVRLHRQDIHENAGRNRLLHTAHPITYSRQPLDQPWPLMRM